jgi:hypothetical protein
LKRLSSRCLPVLPRLAWYVENFWEKNRFVGRRAFLHSLPSYTDACNWHFWIVHWKQIFAIFEINLFTARNMYSIRKLHNILYLGVLERHSF